MPFTLIFVEVMLPIAIAVAVGAAWSHWRGGTAAVLRLQLSELTLYLFAPALMFSIAASSRISGLLVTVPVLLGLGMLVSGLLLYGLLYRSALGADLTNGTRAALLLSGTWGNIFFLGYPVITTLYGRAAGVYPAFADMLCATPLLWSVGVWIATRLGSDATTPVTPLWRELLRLPPVWAFVLGIAANQSGLEIEALVRATAFLGQATIPVMLFVLGLSIPWRRLRPSRAILAVTTVKLVVMPLAVWAIAAAIAVPVGEPARAAIIEAAMPTMLMAVLLADRFRLDTEAAGLMIGWSTVLFWLILPLWLTLFA